MNANSIIPNSYAEARDLMPADGARTVDRNTLIVEMPDGSIGLKFHRTVILTYNVDGTMTVDSGGYRTSTTKERMNQALPDGFRIFAKRGTWYVDAPNGETYEFQDGYKVIPASARAFYSA